MAARVSGTRIIIFAKAPVAGRVKTRLIPALGAEGAASLARRMLRDTAREAMKVNVAEVEVCVDPDPSHEDWRDLLPAERLSFQGEGDLGERLARAAERALGERKRAILIGTDCPQLNERRLRRACRALESHDAVIHPTLDGGYALLGLARFDAFIFSGIAWSTASVARETMARIAALGWSLHIGETLRDVDEPEDLTPRVMLNLFQHPSSGAKAGAKMDPETSSG